jgi:hypothetical protein
MHANDGKRNREQHHHHTTMQHHLHMSSVKQQGTTRTGGPQVAN